MPVYMVERELKGITLDQLTAAQKLAIQTSKEMTAQGRNVRYIRSTFVPGEARCMCLFEAPTDKTRYRAERSCQDSLYSRSGGTRPYPVSSGAHLNMVRINGCLGRHHGLLAVRRDGEAPGNVPRLSGDLWHTNQYQAATAKRPHRARNVRCAARTFAETAWGCNGRCACPNGSIMPSIPR
jgi:hypothetical protein